MRTQQVMAHWSLFKMSLELVQKYVALQQRSTVYKHALLHFIYKKLASDYNMYLLLSLRNTVIKQHNCITLNSCKHITCQKETVIVWPLKAIRMHSSRDAMAPLVFLGCCKESDKKINKILFHKMFNVDIFCAQIFFSVVYIFLCTYDIALFSSTIINSW